MVIRVLSAWPLEQQVNADGATWLDRELVSGAPMPMRDVGFGRQVRQASDARRQWLIQQRLAHEENDQIVYRPNLLATLWTGADTCGCAAI